MPAAALAFAAAAAAPGSAAATPTGLSHGVSIGPTARGVCFAVLGCGLGALTSIRGFTSGQTRRPCLGGPATPAHTGRVGLAAWRE